MKKLIEVVPGELYLALSEERIATILVAMSFSEEMKKSGIVPLVRSELLSSVDFPEKTVFFLDVQPGMHVLLVFAVPENGKTQYYRSEISVASLIEEISVESIIHLN